MNSTHSTALSVFNFSHSQIRVVENDGEPWFVAKDVAEALGYAWKGISTIKHVPEEWRGIYSVQTPSGMQEMSTLSEPGLFFFLNRSDKPQALPMQKFVAGEVLPTIRRTGSYTHPALERNAPPPEVSDTLTPEQAAALQAQIEAMQAKLDTAQVCVPMADWRRMTDPRIKIGHKLFLMQDFIGLMEDYGVPREITAEITGVNRNTLRQHALIARRKGGAV